MFCGIFFLFINMLFVHKDSFAPSFPIQMTFIPSCLMVLAGFPVSCCVEVMEANIWRQTPKSLQCSAKVWINWH